jgi:hypothetical protein
MNIALGALIILLLLLPALFFRLGIFMVRGSVGPTAKGADKFSRELVKKNFINILSKLNFSETLFFFSIVPLFLHVASLWVLSLFRCQVDYDQLLNVFSSGVSIIRGDNNFPHELIGFLIYNIIEALIGFLLGWLFTYVIMSKPDILRSLAGDNVWFKLFTGLLLKEEIREKVDNILVDVLSETKEATVIYSGFLEKFDVNESKQLEYITLNTATRRDVRQGLQITDTTGTAPVTSIKTSVYLDNNGPIADIPGKYFTVLGSKISNVNVTYLHYEVVKDPADSSKIIKESWVKLQ